MIRVRLKEILNEKGMTLTELHELTGISKNTLSLIANNQSKGIQFETMEKLILKLGVSFDQFFEFENYGSFMNITPVENEKMKYLIEIDQISDNVISQGYTWGDNGIKETIKFFCDVEKDEKEEQLFTFIARPYSKDLKDMKKAGEYFNTLDVMQFTKLVKAISRNILEKEREKKTIPILNYYGIIFYTSFFISSADTLNSLSDKSLMTGITF